VNIAARAVKSSGKEAEVTQFAEWVDPSRSHGTEGDKQDLGSRDLASALHVFPNSKLSYSRVTSNLSVVKQVRVKWGGTRLTRMKPVQFQDWLKKMDAAAKTKGHVEAITHSLYEKTMRWETVEWQRNPMELAEVSRRAWSTFGQGILCPRFP
jgi:hypothetical protein